MWTLHTHKHTQAQREREKWGQMETEGELSFLFNSLFFSQFSLTISLPLCLCFSTRTSELQGVFSNDIVWFHYFKKRWPSVFIHMLVLQTDAHDHRHFHGNIKTVLIAIIISVIAADAQDNNADTYVSILKVKVKVVVF